jgi:uncharacterized protein YlxW (UPF0749 family)
VTCPRYATLQLQKLLGQTRKKNAELKRQIAKLEARVTDADVKAEAEVAVDPPARWDEQRKRVGF